MAATSSSGKPIKLDLALETGNNVDSEELEPRDSQFALRNRGGRR